MNGIAFKSYQELNGMSFTRSSLTAESRLAEQPIRAIGLAWRKGDDRAEGFRRIGALIAEAVEDVCRIRR